MPRLYIYLVILTIQLWSVLLMLASQVDYDLRLLRTSSMNLVLALVVIDDLLVQAFEFR